MKLIIGFDSWARGSFHYERLVDAFEKKGYELLLIHIGSWGHDKDRPKEEMAGKLKIRDITYYADQSFKSILIKEKPEAVLFLSTRAFAHQAFNRYANSLNIPTIHLAHGLVGVQDICEGHEAYATNYRSLFSIWMQRIGKNVSKLMPCYVKSLIDSKATAQEWIAFAKEIFDKALAKNNNSIVAPLDAKTTIGLVYTRADIPFFRDGHHLNEKDIYIVGNPDLIRFGLSDKHFGIGLNQTDLVDKEIIYIDTALIQAGVVFQDEAQFVNHLIETHRILAKQGYSMTVKLHPSHFRTGVPDALRRSGIEICENADFVNRLMLSVAAIVEPSSAAIIPALMGKPILLAQYDKFIGQRYGAVLSEYPRARPLSKLDDLACILAAEKEELDPFAFQLWFDQNSGPLPAEEMPDRVAEFVHKVSHTSVTSL